MSAALRDQGHAIADRRPLQAPFDGASLLVVSDDPTLHEAARAVLGDHGYGVRTTPIDASAAIAAAGDADVVLLDASEFDGEARKVLAQLRGAHATVPVVAACQAAAIDRVVDLIGEGALDFVVRPIEAVAHRTRATINQAARVGRLMRDNRRLQQRIALEQAQAGFVGCSPLHRRLLTAVARATDSDATTLIEGKPGTGKTSIAQMIQRGGRRAHAPFVVHACEGLSAEQLDASLQEAQRGTILLEDIDRLPAETQSRLVRYLKDRPDGRSGSQARLIATTSARLPELVARGAFREDLYYRLNVLPIVVPSLAERRDDIAILANHFLKRAAESTGVPAKGFTPSAIVLLETNPWPGNVAQLQNAVQRAHAVAGSNPIDRVHLLGSQAVGIEPGPARPRAPLTEEDDDAEIDEAAIRPFKDEEKRLLSRALRATKGNVRRAAQLLRIGRATLYRKIQSYKLRLH
ncbi:MAG TPA: sigma 54-interacting transcriptional regulator [Planctomycetota bacterium]|nr:sigma 54-interacting transcriptional regulator [Planctomycetota bacterium]